MKNHQLKPYPIWDSALQFHSGMYVPSTFVCLSFDIRKHLPIGRGGMILTDDADAARWFRLARFHGRHEVPRMMDTPEFAGWKMHMYPEDALRGLQLMELMPDRSPDIEICYPDLSKFDAYRSEPSIDGSGCGHRPLPHDSPAGKLVPFDAGRDEHLELTYQLLCERYEEGCVNIPGETPGVPMDPLLPWPPAPSRQDHVRNLQSVADQFICAYLWREAGVDTGFVFLRPTPGEAGSSAATEIGIFVLREFWNRGIGEAAVAQVLERHKPHRVVARINPANRRSNSFFSRLGFHHVCNLWLRDDPLISGTARDSPSAVQIADASATVREQTAEDGGIGR